MIERLKITKRIRLILILAALSFLASSGIGLWSLRSQLMEERRAQLRHLLDMSLSVARADMKAAGGPESQTGRDAFFFALRSAHYGDPSEANYLFAYDYDGVTTVLNDPTLTGHNRIDLTDANGVKILQEFVRIAKGAEGTGFIEYEYEKGVGGPPKPKIALVQNVPEIGGLVGVGAYIDDVDADCYRRLFIEGAMLATVLVAIAAIGFPIGRALMAVTSELEDQFRGAIALQGDMLPSAARVVRIQAHYPLDLASYYGALDGIGGDIWGLEASGPQRLMLYTADFTGHGVAAALNTARFHSFVHISSQRTDKPASLLRRLNRRLHEVLPIGQFATMFCVTLDFEAQTIEYASAGSPPQLYRRSLEHPFELLSQPNLPLGIYRDTFYDSETIPFLPGGGLVLYTDGLIETPKPPHSVFTPESLREFLNASKERASCQICQGITSRLFFDPAIKAEDDLTLIVAKRTGKGMEPVIDYEV
jgi:sigma-B regulation protein RsbU (phosphoserine phosphatase)